MLTFRPWLFLDSFLPPHFCHSFEGLETRLFPVKSRDPAGNGASTTCFHDAKDRWRPLYGICSFRRCWRLILLSSSVVISSETRKPCAMCRNGPYWAISSTSDAYALCNRATHLIFSARGAGKLALFALGSIRGNWLVVLVPLLRVSSRIVGADLFCARPWVEQP